MVFGPLISSSEINVPFAARYDLDYRIVGAPSWTRRSVPLSSTSDPTNITNNTYKLTGLTEGATYEVRMRSVDSTGLWSKWSAIDTFRALPTPWINAFNPGPYYAWIEWGGVGVKSLRNVTTYELEYKRKIDPNWITYEAKLLTP
jgi:hypothetical protein